MKRDMGLIRLILLEQESGECTGKISKYSSEVVGYHSALAIEAGLLRGTVIQADGDNYPTGVPYRLTWACHDFLDAARDESCWRKVTEDVAKKVGSVAFDLLRQLLLEYARKVLLA